MYARAKLKEKRLDLIAANRELRSNLERIEQESRAPKPPRPGSRDKGTHPRPPYVWVDLVFEDNVLVTGKKRGKLQFVLIDQLIPGWFTELERLHPMYAERFKRYRERKAREGP